MEFAGRGRSRDSGRDAQPLRLGPLFLRYQMVRAIPAPRMHGVMAMSFRVSVEDRPRVPVVILAIAIAPARTGLLIVKVVADLILAEDVGRHHLGADIALLIAQLQGVNAFYSEREVEGRGPRELFDHDAFIRATRENKKKCEIKNNVGTHSFAFEGKLQLGEVVIILRIRGQQFVEAFRKNAGIVASVANLTTFDKRTLPTGHEAE